MSADKWSWGMFQGGLLSALLGLIPVIGEPLQIALKLILALPTRLISGILGLFV